MIWVKARSCLARQTDEKKEKDARNILWLVTRLRGPLLFEGSHEEEAKSMQTKVSSCLSEIASAGLLAEHDVEEFKDSLGLYKGRATLPLPGSSN